MQRRQGILFLYLCTAIGALLMLATSMPQLSFRAGRTFILNSAPMPPETPSDAPTSLADIGPWRLLVAAIALALLAYFVLTLIFSAKLRRQLLQRIAGALIALLLFYLLSDWLGSILPRLTDPVDSGTSPPPAQTTIGEPLPPFVAQPTPWLVVIVSLALSGLLIAGIWYFWRRGQPAAHPVTALAQAAIEHIQAGGDLQSIVLRCYLEMSELLGDQRGMPRQRGMTPREFEQQLAADGVRDEHIKQLTRLFEGARYGAQTPNERDERTAIECLAAIVRAYGGAT
ncbi:MAG TPA: DUF4129 domain-containing protein [Roseiflexaceae bacterium]|nr:DUF4129 domain-containing protein [Roseiflexaceae bacterium]